MNQWHVTVSDLAEDDLRAVYRYIKSVLREPQVAQRQARRIRSGINGLNQMPERYPLLDIEPWKSRSVRRMDVDNYAVFYIVNHEKNDVFIWRVFYAKRDFDNLL